jgi:WD40 repeat protein
VWAERRRPYDTIKTNCNWYCNLLLQRPILLQGHERPLTCIKFNADSDLFFSSAKDKHATVWYTATGERLGTYEGHNGSIWNLDVTPDSKHLLTASADNTCKIWDVMTGVCLKTIEHGSPCRNVSVATVRFAPLYSAGAPRLIHIVSLNPRITGCYSVLQGGKMFANAVYPHKGAPSHMKIYKLADDMADRA